MIFESFYQGGFECSTHRRKDGQRLDVIAATGHDRNAESDYRQLREHGILTVRDGFRWHLIEQAPGRYDWASALPMLRAAQRAGTQVIWDLMHYGWPDGLDLWRPAFVDRFARFAAAAARLVREHSDEPSFFCPINEISFHAWAGGQVGYLNPFGQQRGVELKVQLVRAALAAMHEILAVDARARFVHCEPLISIIHDPKRPLDRTVAAAHHQSQFEAFDMIAGRAWPQLGGEPRFLDVVGVNYYWNNQWIHNGRTLDIGHALYRPLRSLLAEVHDRYRRPMLIAETGIEADRRPDWLAYVAEEAREARALGVRLEGLCLYPVVEHPGWDNDRECPNGLLSCAVEDGRRREYRPLADELARQRILDSAASIAEDESGLRPVA